MSLHIRQNTLTPTSLNMESRTFEAVASTGAARQLRDEAGPYEERLDLTGLNMAAITGKPVLDAHRRSSHRDVVGVVTAARMESGSLIVSVKAARGPEGDAILSKIEDGVLAGISIGYAEAKPARVTRESGRRVKTITPDIQEISLVPIPADSAATIRSNTMDPEGDVLETPEANEDTQTRAEVNAEIRAIAQTAGLNRTWADQQVDQEATAEEARLAAFEAMRTRSPATVRTVVSGDAARDYRDLRSEALYARANPSHELSERARGFANDSLVDIARDCLTRTGSPVTGLSASEITTRALHTTGDFPGILGDTVGRTLRVAYEAAPSGIKDAARQTTARDFRARNSLMMGEAPTLEKVAENGEYKRGSIAEAKETFKLDTFGRIVGISRQALVNDDLGAFSSLTMRMGVAAAAFEANTLTTLVEANGEMDDGIALFASGHGNDADSDDYGLSEDSLSKGRLAMRKQTGLSGELISVVPQFLIVPPELETPAEKLLSAIQATKTGDVNPFSRLTLLVEPRLTNPAGWYLTAAPATSDGLEYAYLEGAPGPQTESRQGFDTDGLEIKVRLDFGAGFVDHRAWYRNAGQ